MERELARVQIDNFLDYVVTRSDVIVNASVALDIPIEDLLCQEIRKAARERAVDSRQSQLFRDDSSTEGAAS